MIIFDSIVIGPLSWLDLVSLVDDAGKQLMQVWDRLCHLLRMRQISVEDVSNKVPCPCPCPAPLTPCLKPALHFLP